MKINPWWVAITHLLEWEKNWQFQVLERCRATETLKHCWWECKLVQPLWKSLEVSNKVKRTIKLHLSYDPAIPLSGIYPREINIYFHTSFYMINI